MATLCYRGCRPALNTKLDQHLTQNSNWSLSVEPTGIIPLSSAAVKVILVDCPLSQLNDREFYRTSFFPPENLNSTTIIHQSLSIDSSSHWLIFASSHYRRIIAPLRIALHRILLYRIAPRCIPLRWIVSNFVCFGLLLAALFPVSSICYRINFLSCNAAYVIRSRAVPTWDQTTSCCRQNSDSNTGCVMKLIL